jgi:glycosyltransferase involved in cell wall biosynthesis
MTLPKISFGIIVLNGQPFTKYCLRQLYPHAHEIIVVEGAVTTACNIAPQGHSTDGTIEALEEFKKNEDQQNKLKIVKQDGFWEEKDQQSQTYAKTATGDYLWQVDIDEFYKDRDIEKVRKLLAQNPDIDAISFRQITFWGWFDYCCNSVYLRSLNASEYHRLFKWNVGYKYASHRPPTVIDENDTDLHKKNWLSAKDTEKMGIYLYHYSLLFPKQVMEKCNYYSRPGGGFMPDADKWVQNCYFSLKKPFKVHNVHKYPGWLTRYKGTHPEQIEKMHSDILNNKLQIETRPNDDIEQLLQKKSYNLAVNILVLLDWLLLFKMIIVLRRILLKPFRKGGKN